jgi:hypothetical protein
MNNDRRKQLKNFNLIIAFFVKILCVLCGKLNHKEHKGKTTKVAK